MTNAIKLCSVSKCYRRTVSHDKYPTLRDALADVFTRPFRNWKAIQKLGEYHKGETSEDLVWALQNVSLDVNWGEAMGIIGSNGSGKSTLLKVLARVTEPTEGYFELYGKVASLLEVGIGFHPELSGRENIYLSGTMLGMTRNKIDLIYDEIVEFSGIDKFIDTPVKRYSSGMYVRLAYSLASHLDADILLLDEVLSVGDIAFQEKCLKHIQALIREGKAILFTSHSMGLVRDLCTRTLWLNEGHIMMCGNTREVTEGYENFMLGRSMNPV